MGLEGYLTSPAFPHNYMNNADCEYVVRMPVRAGMLLQFDVFDLEDHTICAYDYLEVLFINLCDTDNTSTRYLIKQ